MTTLEYTDITGGDPSGATHRPTPVVPTLVYQRLGGAQKSFKNRMRLSAGPGILVVTEMSIKLKKRRR